MTCQLKPFLIVTTYKDSTCNGITIPVLWIIIIIIIIIINHLEFHDYIRS